MSSPKAGQEGPERPSAPGGRTGAKPARISPGREASSKPADTKKSVAGAVDWLKELTRQEHDRVAEIEKFNLAAGPFLAALHHQILSNLESYRKEFPGTLINSSLDPSLYSIEVINQSRGNPAPQVRISTNSADQTLQLAFEFRPNLNKELPMSIVDGKLTVEMNGGVSAEAISQLALTPVLFPELTTNTLLYDSFGDVSGRR